VRLQKFLAEAGVASRRASEEIILSGRVTIDGETIRELGVAVDPARQRIAVDGHPVKTRRKFHVALNKPRGYLCTRRDPHGGRTIAELLPKEWGNLYSVGRLDRDSEGLIFLTNDGQFCLQLTHPRYGIRKTYRVTIQGRVEQPVLDKFVRGISDCGERLRAESARMISANNTQSVVEMELTEGKNREVRRLFGSQGLIVLRLQRVRIGPISLGELPAGKWRTLTEPEIKSLLPKL
jgi:23S rRNA pseudouridine2605 synthase